MMKKIFLLLPVLALFFASCEEDNNWEYNPNRTDIIVQNTNVYLLDPGASASIEADATATEVNTNVGVTVSLSSGKGTFTATKSQLGISSVDDTKQVEFTATINGYVSYAYAIFTMMDPLSVSEPGAVILNSVNDTITYEIDAASTTPDAITVMQKINSGSAVEVSKTGGWDVSSDDIVFSGDEFAEGDTVTYSVTATNANGSVSHSVSFVVGKYTFPASDNFTLSQDTMAYDFVDGAFVKVSNVDSSDIARVVVPGQSVGFTSLGSAEFVKTTEAVYTTADVNTIEDEFNSGVAVTTVNDATVDEYYIYKTVRIVDTNTITYYGLLKITELQGAFAGQEDQVAISFERKYLE
ncbi:hypothetical protein [Prolixibacter sp. NT017]|uniref:hypothetical protein n=1 Tax=Prolixibacter sp. NT017 TaxID=2652390 RepID=UPI00126FF5E5|nr:hypothetical protein [Prolixibacter sp. NT017]GET24213.1 hypothetical protein NT017_05420 [Prolixibacter sp. NT017]